MIKSMFGETKAKGTSSELLADMCCVISTVYEEVLLPNMSEEEAKEVIYKNVEMALKEDDELDDEIPEDISEQLDSVIDGLADLLKKLEKKTKGKGEE